MKHILSDINLSIANGEFISLVGRNGSGKTTLAKVIAGLSPVSKGSIDCTSGPIQMVFQNPEAQIVGQTIYEDMCFGLENYAVPRTEMKDRVQAALDSVGFAHKPNALVEELSGGQKQLLCIASAVVLRPDILIFDESTAMLDPQSRQRVLHIAQALHASGMTVLWLTQWLDDLAWDHRVIALDAGRVVFDGRSRDFFYAHLPMATRGGFLEVSPGASQTACQQLGFKPPYVVEVANELERLGTSVGRPLTPEELRKAVQNSVH